MIDPDQLRVATAAVRTYADGTSYGKFISAAICHEIAVAVLQALEDLKAGTVI